MRYLLAAARISFRGRGASQEERTMQAYCLKCRTQREMSDPQEITMKNGKPATQGKCPVCGTKMYRIGSAAKK
jgi:hypothetical protein